MKNIKLKDLLTSTKNKSNNQVNFSLRKRKLKELGMNESDLLNMKVKKIWGNIDE